jgi:hypothetical protein
MSLFGEGLAHIHTSLFSTFWKGLRVGTTFISESQREQRAAFGVEIPLQTDGAWAYILTRKVAKAMIV